MPKKIDKTPVDINEGTKLFNEYYEKKHKGKPVSIKRAKFGDAYYQKKKNIHYNQVGKILGNIN